MTIGGPVARIVQERRAGLVACGRPATDGIPPESGEGRRAASTALLKERTASGDPPRAIDAMTHAIRTPRPPRRPHPGIQVTRHRVPITGLPASLDGATLVQVSDLHRGCGGTDELIHEAVARASALGPDFVCLTGDFVDEDAADVLPVVSMVSAVRARRRVFAVLGNHDHRGDPVLLASALEAAGICVLQNEAVELAPGFWLAGTDDLHEGQGDLDVALASVPPDAPGILLSHNPNALDRVDSARPLVILSGHTHGGQIVLPFVPPWLVCLVHLRTRYVHGWHERGRLRLYVNRGIGVTGSRPFARRVGCPPEISVFHLLSVSRAGNGHARPAAALPCRRSAPLEHEAAAGARQLP